MYYQVQYQCLNKVTISSHDIAFINHKDLEHACLSDFILTCSVQLNYQFH